MINYKIYQPKKEKLTFHEVELPMEDMNLVYEDSMNIEENLNREAFLEMLFTKFNINRPEDFKGHSLSVGDYIELITDEDGSQIYMVGDFGFKPMFC